MAFCLSKVPQDARQLACDVQGRNTICLPLRASRKESARQVQLEIMRRFEYDPKMMMSGVIAKSKSSTHCERAQVLIKGASYEVSQLADPDSLPKDWAQVQQPRHHSSIQVCTALCPSIFARVCHAASLCSCLVCMVPV